MSDSTLTKRAIASALKELCRTKSFAKISIADITELCGLTRQTFYYHFQDKFELLNWVYYNEGFLPATDGITFDNWDKKLLSLLQKMTEEKQFYSNTIKCQEEVFTEYLYQIANQLFYEAAELLDAKKELSEDSKKFFAQFNAFGICGVVIAWAKGGMKTPPEKVASNLKSLVANSKQLAVDRFSMKGLN